MTENRHAKQRKKKLINPRLQLKLVGTFLGISALGFVMQALLMSSRLMDLAGTLPTGGTALQEEIPDMLTETLLVSFGLLLPLTLSVGILITFRVAGPVYRFEQHLGRIARGEAVGPCKIREGDEFQGLCRVMNEAVERLSEGRAADPVPGEAPEGDDGTEVRKRAA